MCHIDYNAALDDQIAVTFTINSDIRRIAFHDPGSLSIADYSFRYKTAIEGLLPDGTPFAAVKESHVAAMAYLEPGHTTAMEVEVTAGQQLLGYSVDCDSSFLLTVDPALPAAERRLAMRG